MNIRLAEISENSSRNSPRTINQRQTTITGFCISPSGGGRPADPPTCGFRLRVRIVTGMASVAVPLSFCVGPPDSATELGRQSCTATEHDRCSHEFIDWARCVCTYIYMYIFFCPLSARLHTSFASEVPAPFRRPETSCVPCRASVRGKCGRQSGGHSRVMARQSRHLHPRRFHMDK